jgi:hypothetical protein
MWETVYWAVRAFASLLLPLGRFIRCYIADFGIRVRCRVRHPSTPFREILAWYVPPSEVQTFAESAFYSL